MPLPDHRASDLERERVADHVRGAAGEGRLTVEELDERLSRVYAATTTGELSQLTADLPAPAPAPAVAPGEGTRWVVSVMGGAERLGDWRVAERCNVVSVMGGADIDLTHAKLAAPVVEIRVISIMGGADIYVPADMNVEVSGFALMGGNSVRLDERTPNPGGPTVRLRLISIMGGADVKRGPKKRLRDRLRRSWHPPHP